MGRPDIRFKGYTDEWEQRKLGELAEIVGGGTPSTSIDSYWDGDIDWYAPAEIGEQIYLKSSQRKITEEGLNKSSAKVLPVGTVLFTSRAGIGKTAILLKEGCTNQGFQSIVPSKDKLDSYFIFTRSEELKRYGEIVGAGSTFVEVSGKQMANMELMMPTTMDEQQKIGEYFSDLDNLITLHQRKCDEVKSLKKYMLQKMFPQNEQKVPEIRFEGFTEAWEQRKLDDVVEFLDTMRKPLEGAKRISGPYPYYGASGIVDYVDGYLFDEELILLSEDGANITDRNYPVCFLASGKYWVNNHAHVLRTKQANENNFICNSLERKDYTQYNTGMAMPKLNKETCKKIPILCPGFEEQKKVGDYFRNLDHLITLHQQKCEELKKIKKFMLQKMFV